jgi:hypothetical protein
MPNDTAEDSPFVDLDLLPNGVGGEVEAWFRATMYLMWQPGSASGCSGAACTIPVPLLKVDWWWTGDAINTLQNQPSTGTNWSFTGCENCSRNPGGLSTNAHPEWTARFDGASGCVRMQ